MKMFSLPYFIFSNDFYLVYQCTYFSFKLQPIKKVI